MMFDSGFPFEWLTRQSQLQSDRTFLIYKNKVKKECILSYKEVALYSDNLAILFRNNYPRNTIIGVHMQRGPEYIIVMFAAWKAGMIFMPFTDNLSHRDVPKFVQHLEIASQFFSTSYVLISDVTLELVVEHSIVFDEEFMQFINIGQGLRLSMLGKI